MSAAAAAGHHHHGSHAVSSHLHDKGAAAAEYILPTSADMNCNSNADLAAAAAAASAVHLPTLMHMGYGHRGERDRLRCGTFTSSILNDPHDLVAAAGPHHHHLRQQQSHLAENQANMCSYLQHRSAW